MLKDQCRNCFHSWEMHGHCGSMMCFQDMSTPNESMVFCGCEEYIPKNNLEFLEWKYERHI
jgi:hypothetical protein